MMGIYFLSSLDNVRFKLTRECVFERRLRFNTGKDCALVKIDPPVSGQDFGLGADIKLLIIANRYEGERLFPIASFPCSVYIARPLIGDIQSRSEITKDEVDLIAWGDLFRTRSDSDRYLLGALPTLGVAPRPPLSNPLRVWTQRIQFLVEQDGPSECKLKNELAKLFDRSNWVRVAYLARISYPENAAVGVALCVVGQPGEARSFAKQVGIVFSGIFGAHEHLDIVWVTPEQELELKAICQPFWRAA